MAHAVLTAVYTGHQPTLTSTGAPLEFRFRTQDVGPVGVDLLRHSWQLRSRSEPLRDFVASRVLAGRLTQTIPGEHVRLAAGDSMVQPSGVEFDMSWVDLTISVVRLPTTFLASYAAARAGIAEADFRFHCMSPISAAANRSWGQVCGYVVDLLRDPESTPVHPLVQQEIAQLLAAAAVAAFPNTVHTQAYAPSPGTGTPAALRRAIGHIEAHAAEPITLADIAAAARIGARALQHAFRRHHDTTPMAYLRLTRLERAHRELQAADPTDGATVAATAARWGFARPDRFSAAYRRVYGCSPASTLRS